MEEESVHLHVLIPSELHNKVLAYAFKYNKTLQQIVNESLAHSCSSLISDDFCTKFSGGKACPVKNYCVSGHGYCPEEDDNDGDIS
jgi:hypothetical protein